jgi:sigma-B regulation protein RsbU (phosphoserine phosphatase)
VKPRDLEDLRPGGLGTHFIREIMDATDFLRPAAGTGNVLRLRKRIE